MYEYETSYLYVCINMRSRALWPGVGALSIYVGRYGDIDILSLSIYVGRYGYMDVLSLSTYVGRYGDIDILSLSI